MPATAMVTVIMVVVGFFALIFGIVYMQKRENLAMLEKGMNPRQVMNRPAPYRNLKWGLLLVGAGTGLLLAYILHEFVLVTYDKWGPHHRNNPFIYFALIAIGGGIGLIISYRVEKKDLLDRKSDV
jgi:hypothetical protein